MRKHMSVFALCIRVKLWKLLLTLAAAAGISTAAFFILGLERAWGNGGGPGILALRILFVLSYIAVMITCFSPDTKRVKTCYFLQRLQISERAFLLWDALAAALCFLLFYCAQILTVFGLACVYQRSAGYALGPQGVFLMLARDSFLHGLLPFGESVIWTRNILYMVCAGLSCAAASLARRNRNRGGTPMFALVFIISRMPVTLGEGDASCLWLAVVLIVGLLALWFALFVLLGSFLIFVIRYENARSRLYEDVLGRRLLRSGAQIDPLAEILSGTFRLAVVYGILTFVNIAANYMTFYRESKSIYLMRRIPDRWELPRRCAAVPLIGLAAGLILTAILICLCNLIYFKATPPQCIPAGEHFLFWRAFG